MKTIVPIILTVIFFVALQSCKVGSQKEVDSYDKKKDSAINKTDAVVVMTDSVTTEVGKKVEKVIKKEVLVKDREPTDDEIREFGILTNIEDGQYPQFTLTVEFPDRHSEADFNLNIESIPQSVAALNALKGKYVTIYYTDSEENMLMDIHFKGKTLYGQYAPEMDDGYKQITGVLGGADHESGDTPSEIWITSPEGKKMLFKEFVTKEIMAKNGKTVTGYYYQRFSRAISYLKPSPN